MPPKGATAEVEKPNVRTAEAEAEIFEVELPEGLALKGAEDVPAAEGEEATEEQPEGTPATPKAAKPDKSRADKKDDRLPASTREERAKRKDYAKKYEDAAAERDRLEAELRARRGQTPQVGMSKEYREALVKRGNEAESMGQLVEIFLEEQGKRDQFWSVALDEERFNRHLHVSETIARNNVDAQYGRGTYDRVLREAGIKEAITLEGNGQFRDPGIAKKIYGERDPGLEAFEIALGKLDKEGRLDKVLAGEAKVIKDTDADHEVEEDPEPKSKARKAESNGDAAGERRAGAREVIDTVAGHSSKPRGLQALKPAAPPKRGVTREDIDKMSEKDRGVLFKANPTAKDWWLGGIESV